MKDDEFNALRDELSGSSRFPSRTELIERFGAVERLDEPDHMVDAIMSLLIVRGDYPDPVDVFAEGVANSPSLEISEELRPQLAARVIALATLSPLAGAARAHDVFTEHERILTGARIFTDIRPVFGEDAGTGPLGAIVFHTLKIESVHNGNHDAHFFGMDNADLSRLHTVIERAVVKNQSLSEVLDTIGFSRFDMGDEQG